MKSFRNIFLPALILLATSCMPEALPGPAVDEGDGGKVTVNFSVGAVLKEQEGWGDGAGTKAFDEMTDAKRDGLKLRVYVFDQYGLFLEYADATTPDPSKLPTDFNKQSDETVFSVEITRSNNPRRLHFVAVGSDTYSVTQKYAYGSEGTFMNGLSVSGDTDAYWARVLVDNIDDQTHFRRIPLLRNFAKITLKAGDGLTGFVPESFTIVNVPGSGSVAPYNTSSGGFASFHTNTTSTEGGVTTITTTMATYKGLLAQRFKGYQPQGVTWDKVTPTEGSGDSGLSFIPLSKAFYMYESPNADGTDKGRTFMIVKGKYGGSSTSTYYKIDITYKETEGYGFTEQEIKAGAGVATFYNILRNFNYEVHINKATFEGYSSAYEAAIKPAANNISASVLADGVNNVSDGNKYRRLFVNKIYALYNEGGAMANLKTKAYTTENILQNDEIEIKVLEDDGIFDVEPYIDKSSEARDAESYNPIKFTLKSPDDTPKTATIRLYINEQPTYETLYRDITIVLRKHYPLKVDCQDVVAKATGTSFKTQLLIPDGINKNLFPLKFQLEPVSKTIYPDASQNQLPVDVGATIVPSLGDESSFQYVKTITHADYVAAATKTVDGVVYKVIDCWFKTNTAESSTSIYAYNEYFVKAYDDFDNGSAVFEDGDLAVATVHPSDYYGAGNSYNYVVFKTVRATGSVDVTLTEGTSTPETEETKRINLNQATYRTTNVDGTYTYRIPFYTKTFKESTYSASVKYVPDTNYSIAQEITGTAVQERRYLFIPEGSFAPTNLVSEFGATERFKSGILYEDIATTDPANCGRVAFNAQGANEHEGRVTTNHEDDNYFGFKFEKTDGYHIGVFRHTSYYPSLDPSWKLRFYHSTSGAHNAPEDASHTWRDDWYAEVTIEDITKAHAIDFKANASDNAAAPANGLFKMPLEFVAP